MTTTWIIAADASRARILQVAGRERLVEVEDLVNPEGRLHNQEINTDEVPKDLSWFNTRELESYLRSSSGT
jgi:protein required for attachment to host cells